MTSLLSNIDALNRFRRTGARPNAGLGLVMTMGGLHAGHAALIRRAKQQSSRIVVSIFVNPTQFGANEDYATYPRDLEADMRRCTELGVDAVFTPQAADVFPYGLRTAVHAGPLGDCYEGAHRPGHFVGVATVVCKFLQLIRPQVAYFGRKDLQQLRIVQAMVDDLHLPVEIADHPTVRDADGLALSSRNVFLDATARLRALSIPRSLAHLDCLWRSGERTRSTLEHCLRAQIDPDLAVDYAALVDVQTLAPEAPRIEAGQAAALIAARCGRIRLIDNLILGLDQPPQAG